MLTQNELKEALSYDRLTGVFKWKDIKSNKIKEGDLAGCKDNRYGYWLIRIKKVLYRAHRLAWMYEYGKFPKNDVDHINHNRTDNRIVNLRSVNRSTNMKNGNVRKDNQSGVIGVSWSKSRKKWRAVIMTKEKYKHIGYFDDKSSAVKARLREEKINNYHKNHGKVTPICPLR